VAVVFHARFRECGGHAPYVRARQET
jgi:hypothetical protein